MTAVAGRRLVVATALLAGAALLAAGSVHADTGYLPYSCELPDPIGTTELLIQADTNAPSPLYLGTSFAPVLTTRAQVPPSLSNAVAALGARSVDGTIVSRVATNGVVTPVTQQIKNQPIPPSTKVPVTIVATGPMAKLTAKPGGSTTYVPGDLLVSLNFRSSGGGSVASFSDLDCSVPETTKRVDTVAYAKSPTKVTPSATYSKGKKKVIASVRVTATSKVVPGGKVTAVLYRGSKKVTSVSATLKSGKASATFGGVSKKGSYKVVVSYGGSPVANPSTASKSFTVR